MCPAFLIIQAFSSSIDQCPGSASDKILFKNTIGPIAICIGATSGGMSVLTGVRSTEVVLYLGAVRPCLIYLYSSSQKMGRGGCGCREK